MSNSVDKERAVHVAYLDFSKAFSGLHCNREVQVLELPDLSKEKSNVFLNFFAKIC